MAEKKLLFNNFAKKILQLRQHKSDELPAQKPVLHLEQNSVEENPKNITETKNMVSQNASSNDNFKKLENPDFTFENSELKAYIERGVHKQEKQFAMHDHMFYIKVQPKDGKFPLLLNILDFLERACNYILDELKELYNLDDNNVCYMTIYQEPIINGISKKYFPNYI